MSETEQSKGSIGKQVWNHLFLPLLPVIGLWILGVFSTPLGLKYLLTIFMALTVLVYPLLVVNFIEKRGPKLHVVVKVAFYATVFLVLMGAFSLFPVTIGGTFNMHSDERELSERLTTRYGNAQIGSSVVKTEGSFLVREVEGNLQILIPYQWSKKEFWSKIDRNYAGHVLLEGPGSLNESTLNFDAFRLKDYDIRPTHGVPSFFLAWAEGLVLFRVKGHIFVTHLKIAK